MKISPGWVVAGLAVLGLLVAVGVASAASPPPQGSGGSGSSTDPSDGSGGSGSGTGTGSASACAVLPREGNVGIEKGQVLVAADMLVPIAVQPNAKSDILSYVAQGNVVGMFTGETIRSTQYFVSGQCFLGITLPGTDSPVRWVHHNHVIRKTTV
jgi:hypothetical protein